MKGLHALILKYSPFSMIFIPIKILTLKVIYKNKRQLSRVIENSEKTWKKRRANEIDQSQR